MHAATFSELLLFWTIHTTKVLLTTTKGLAHESSGRVLCRMPSRKLVRVISQTADVVHLVNLRSLHALSPPYSDLLHVPSAELSMCKHPQPRDHNSCVTQQRHWPCTAVWKQYLKLVSALCITNACTLLPCQRLELSNHMCAWLRGRMKKPVFAKVRLGTGIHHKRS